jgi:hypothetical protein
LATNAKKPAPPADPALAGIDRLTEIAKDVLYVGVGAGVMAFQRAQVQRVELTKALEERMAESRRQFADLAKAFTTTTGGQFARLDEQAMAIEARVDDVLDALQQRLPKPAAELLDQARTAARTTRTQVRELLDVA